MDEIIAYDGTIEVLNKLDWILSNTVMSGRIFTGIFYLVIGIFLADSKGKQMDIFVGCILAIQGVVFGSFGIEGSLPIIMLSIGFFIIAINLKLMKRRIYYVLRKMSTVIYFSHLWVWSLFYWIIYGEKTYGVIPFVGTIVISLFIAIGYIFIYERYKKICI